MRNGNFLLHLAGECSTPYMGRSVTWRYGGAVVISLVWIATALGTGSLCDQKTASLTLPCLYQSRFSFLRRTWSGTGFAAHHYQPCRLFPGSAPVHHRIERFEICGRNVSCSHMSGLVVSVLGELGRNAILQATSEGDVSKVAQQHLMVSQERLNIAEQVVAGGVWDWDLVNGSLYWTVGYRRLFDYPLHEEPSREKWLDGIRPRRSRSRDRNLGRIVPPFAATLVDGISHPHGQWTNSVDFESRPCVLRFRLAGRNGWSASTLILLPARLAEELHAAMKPSFAC